MWSSFRAVLYKELIQLGRNSMYIRMMIVMQTVQLVLLGAIDVNVRDLPTVIVDQDHSSQSRELTQKLAATRTFAIKYTTSSVAQARAHVRAGRAKIAVVIPPSFHVDRASGRTAKVLALIDGSDSVASGQALASLEGMTAQIQVEREAPSVEDQRAVRAHSMLLFNPEGRTSNFMLPALLALILTNAYLGLAASSLIDEREKGTLERLLMTPLDFWGLMMGKVAPYLLVATGNIALLLSLMRWVFGVPFRGSVLLAFGGLVLFAATMLAIGVFFAASSRSHAEAGMRQIQYAVPAMLLSGYVFPLTSIPTYLLPISYSLPTTHAIEIMRAILLRGAGLQDLWVNFLFLTIAPVFIIGAAVRKFRRTLGV